MNPEPDEIVNLNVGGTRFSTSKRTLLSIPETFFTSLLSDHQQLINSLKDATGAFFIDRDPKVFTVILNYLRTRQLIHLDNIPIEVLLHEAEFYGLTPLVKRLKAYQDLAETNVCGGNVFFQGILQKPAGLMGDDSSKVIKVLAQHNVIVVCFKNLVVCYYFRDSIGFQKIFESEEMENDIDDIALYQNCLVFHPSPASGKLVIGLCQDGSKYIKLWNISFQEHQEAIRTEIGPYALNDHPVDTLFFIGSQLVALSHRKGLVGVYHATSQYWLVQGLKEYKGQSITAYDKAATNFLLLGSKVGSLYLIDMQKFPLRMKDGDLLINELYQDPENEEITAISCYLTQDPKNDGNWVEIAYGTADGTVRVLIQHPETGGHGPVLFLTFKVHLHGISSIMLSQSHLISMCSKRHVRTWTMTRFRGRISTQPGSTPHASFRVLSIDDLHMEEDCCQSLGSSSSTSTGTRGMSKSVSDLASYNKRYLDVGPFGDQGDGEQLVFIEMYRSQADSIHVLMASDGERKFSLHSVDDSPITTYFVHECDTISMVNRSKRYIFTGHENGNVQIWDLSWALDSASKTPKVDVKPDKELLRQVLL
ncbi:BTB/POZ domain-containing protein KCTD3-like [Tetranychus urticae]|uniref:BTB domain-containing protein n=1 Tax=Tetranychus urticae TaxID=32264 RepID=T1KHB6_TETUR|nr:BTB/POZ domain-containing protein KCTD3-like [Tetranychus urticae]